MSLIFNASSYELILFTPTPLSCPRQAMQMPPVIWAMIIFGILAHVMARSTQPPQGEFTKGGLDQIRQRGLGLHLQSMHCSMSCAELRAL